MFVERHFPTADVLRRSARDLGVQDRCEMRSGDVLLWAPPAARPAAGHGVGGVRVAPWGFFAADHAPAELMALIDVLRRAAPPGSTLVVESDTSVTAADLPDPDAWESRPIPPAVLHLLRS